MLFLSLSSKTSAQTNAKTFKKELFAAAAASSSEVVCVAVRKTSHAECPQISGCLWFVFKRRRVLSGSPKADISRGTLWQVAKCRRLTIAEHSFQNCHLHIITPISLVLTSLFCTYSQAHSSLPGSLPALQAATMSQRLNDYVEDFLDSAEDAVEAVQESLTGVESPREHEKDLLHVKAVFFFGWEKGGKVL